jgi:hypothetical protein
MKNIVIAALFILVFAGCSASMNIPPKTETGLKITITSDINKARTLYPVQPVFSKYVLELTGEYAWQDQVYPPLENGEASTTIPLSPGEWTIKVTGYTKILDNEYAAAEGTKKVTVTDGIAAVSVEISALQVYSQNGFLSFSASYPEEAVSDAELYIYHVGDIYYDQNYKYYWNLKDEENPLPALIEIEPGYYMMTLLLDVEDSLNDYYRTVTWTEVIHIYSGMETHAEKTFTLDDLNRFITLGGPLDVKINGHTPDEVFVRLYRDANYTDSFGFAYTNSTTNTWQTSIPVLNDTSNTTKFLYLKVEASYEGNSFSRELGSRVVGHTDIVYPINIAFSDAITLSGTANVRINGSSVGEAWVVVYDRAAVAADDDDEDGKDGEIGKIRVASNGSWQMLLASTYIGTEVSFRVIAIDRAKGYNLSQDTGTPITLSDQNDLITIDVNFTTIQLSGTANVTVNGRPPSYATIEVYRRANTIWVASCVVNLNNFSWEISLPVAYNSDNIYIRIEGYDYNEKWFSQLLRNQYKVSESGTTINFNNTITN